jgi:hypothetical protein
MARTTILSGRAIGEAKASSQREREYRLHDIYFVEDNEEKLFIPGGKKLVRRKFVYDHTSRIALVLHYGENDVKSVGEEAVLNKLDRLVKHQIRAFKRGIFIRRMNYPEISVLRSLLDIMHDWDVLLGGIKPDSYAKRKQEYLNMLFDLAISEG